MTVPAEGGKWARSVIIPKSISVIWEEIVVQGKGVFENKFHCNSVVHLFPGVSPSMFETFRKAVPPASAGKYDTYSAEYDGQQV